MNIDNLQSPYCPAHSQSIKHTHTHTHVSAGRPLLLRPYFFSAPAVEDLEAEGGCVGATVTA